MPISQQVGVLTPNIVETVILDSDADEVEVWGSGYLTFRVDGVDPVADDPEGYNLPVAGARIVSVPTPGSTVIKLLSDDAVGYLVTVI